MKWFAVTLICFGVAALMARGSMAGSAEESRLELALEIFGTIAVFLGLLLLFDSLWAAKGGGLAFV